VVLLSLSRQFEDLGHSQELLKIHQWQSTYCLFKTTTTRRKRTKKGVKGQDLSPVSSVDMVRLTMTCKAQDSERLEKIENKTNRADLHRLFSRDYKSNSRAPFMHFSNHKKEPTTLLWKEHVGRTQNVTLKQLKF